jgi:hypothetical protein
MTARPIDVQYCKLLGRELAQRWGTEKAAQCLADMIRTHKGVNYDFQRELTGLIATLLGTSNALVIMYPPQPQENPQIAQIIQAGWDMS